MNYNVFYTVKGSDYTSNFKIRVSASSKSVARELALNDLSNVFRRDHIEIIDTVLIETNTKKFK